jgi:hypothetical protein
MKYSFYLILFTLVLFSCAKSEVKMEPEPEAPADYRSAWVGDYDVFSSCYSWMLGEPGTTSEFNEVITVSIIPGTSDSISLNGTMNIPIDSNGTYFSSPFPSNYYDLRLWQDSLEIHFNSGGLGGGSGCSKVGVKIL